MSGQLSGWRERLHANPSRMEEELAIKLQDDQIRYLTQVEIPVPGSSASRDQHVYPFLLDVWLLAGS